MKKLETNLNHDYGLDIIRIIAMFFVILVHSTTFYGFIDEGIHSFGLFLAGIGRYLSFACVPLFIMLTGYLSLNKTPTLKYYVKLLRILIEFVICAIVVALFRRLYLHDTMSIGAFLKGVLRFSFPNYSWYINMFVGLYCLAPFLNYILKAIPQNYVITLVIVLLFLFSFPIASPYWEDAYPLMYYFFGALIRVNKDNIKVKKIYLIAIIIIVTLLQTVQVKYQFIPVLNVNNHYNVGCVVLSVCIFLLFCNKTSNSKNATLKKSLRIIANASLSTFLVSSIFETLTMQYFSKLALTSFSEKLPYLLYLTPLKFIASVLVAIIINIVAIYIYKLFILLLNKITKNKYNFN